jgi:hypothetical protein
MVRAVSHARPVANVINGTKLATAASRVCLALKAGVWAQLCRITELTNYEFNDMNWEFLPAPYGCIAEWTVSSNTVKSTGKSTGPMLGINRFIVTGGKITKVTISNSEIHQVASACASA